ncbi:MAG: class I SAM-dependent methyltransferase [bacterium]|nr:class I SAM-dependent methyltransferase [bacterium]
MLDLNDCQCPRCKQVALRYEGPAEIPPRDILDNAIRCTACDARYDVVWGIPFLGVYGEEDLPGLIEIAANAENYTREGKSDRQTWIEPWIDMLDEVHLSLDRDAVLARYKLTEQDKAYLPNRYNEYLCFRMVTHGLSFAGKKILDVGAGLGFDSCRYLRMGASVTCFDYSPILSYQGYLNVPEARWIAGTAPVLPFADGTFDVAVANAALHHIRDVPGTIQEMMRVVKPGGLVMTMIDSYRPDSTDADYVVQIFKDYPPVLMGVNEGVPRLTDFLSPLHQWREHLSTEVFTFMAGARFEKRFVQQNTPYHWTLDEARQHLSEGGGVVNTRSTLHRAIQPQQPQLPAEIISPGDYARSLQNQAEALARLARLMPDRYVDLPLLDRSHTMLRLLNGWKPVEAGQDTRTAYSRARLFLRRQPQHTCVNATVLAPCLAESHDTQLAILVDGQEVVRQPLTRGVWTNVSAPLVKVTASQVSAVELRLLPPHSQPDANLFQVRRLELSSAPINTPPTFSDVQQPSIETLVAFGIISSKSVRVLFTDDLTTTVNLLNRMRLLGLTAQAIVARG